MLRKPLLIIVILLGAVVAAFAVYRKISAQDPVQYRFTAIERGDVEAAVSATGALGAVTTVQVGTQVSGQISEIRADFNDRVEKGQLIARIDPTLQQQAVQDAQASLDRAHAELQRARLEFDRNQGLFENKVLTEVEFNSARYNHEVALANVKSAQVALQRAKRNLQYTTIFSPIDGIVVERNVDVGQTVAANYSTPQLFLIAQDLAQMQILAAVDESDIGRIMKGQPVRFTVQAYPNQRFEGRVEQVRLQSTTAENVVNYTVVVNVGNRDGRLLPGMTTTLEFLTGSAEDVLLVSNTALRFRPPQAILAQLPEQPARRRPGGGASADAGEGSAGGSNTERSADDTRVDGERRGSRGRLWYLNDAGKLTPMTVRTGISDGQKTEVQSDTLEAGMQVVIGAVQTKQNTPSLFTPQTSGPPRRGGF